MNIYESFNNEFGYLCQKYFSNAKVEPYHSYANIVLSIGDSYYERFQYPNNIEMYIPADDDLLLDDFNEIFILYYYHLLEFGFKVIKKENGIVKIKEYEYLNDNGIINTYYSYDEFDDRSNMLYALYLKSNLDISDFIYKRYLKDSDIKRRIKCFSYIRNDVLKYYVSSFTKPLQCEKEVNEALNNKTTSTLKYNNQLLMEMNENMVNNKINNIKVKMK